MTIVENKENQEKVREFKLTTLALKNKNTVYLVLFILLVFGIISYITMPKELFPEIKFPTVFVQTVYPGNSPEDIENLITRPLENELQSVKGLNKLNSNSMQDFSMIYVEFNTNIDIKEALVDVKDAIDKAKSELPNDLMSDPIAMDFDFSSLPVLNVNLSGDYSSIQLKDYAEYLQDEFERVFEISKVDISGVDDRQILIEIDLYKMEAMDLSFQTIENAVMMENITMAGGELNIGKTLRSVRTVGEFKSLAEIENIILRQDPTQIIYLKDVANIIDGFVDKQTYARLDGSDVVTLSIVKKDGENVISAIESVKEIVALSQVDGSLPSDLKVVYSFDQSLDTKRQLSNLENSIILGVILVILVLFFFLGLRNAIIVGLAIPLSIFITFVIMNIQGAQINMIVLFSLILALGMLVDNGIVVVENITRFRDNGYSRFESARRGVGEIAMPIISSTLTTLAAFLPLMFWGGMMGEFMKYMPITLIVVLTSSLFVGLVIIPVMTNTFERASKDNMKKSSRKHYIIGGTFTILAIVFYAMGAILPANLFAIVGILMLSYQIFMKKLSIWFQEVLLAWLELKYLTFIRFSLRKRNPQLFIIGMFLLFIITAGFFGTRGSEVLLFPASEPGMITILGDLPLGTDIAVTDSTAKIIEAKVLEVIGDNTNIVESVLSTVGTGVRGMNEMSAGSATPHRFMVQINFLEFEFRGGVKTTELMSDIGTALIGQYPGLSFALEGEDNSPNAGNPINIEVAGKDFDVLLQYSDSIIKKIQESPIAGYEGLKTDILLGKPELLVEIDRDKAQRYGVSTMTVASTIRTALFGKEISDFKIGEDEYPINIRLAEKYRTDINTLMNQKITFMNQQSGAVGQVPISAVANFEYGTTYGSVNRIDMNRVVTIYSGLLPGGNSAKINQQIKQLLADQQLPDGYTMKFTGQQEETEDTTTFMMQALLLIISLMTIILVTQFNSFIKPIIIIASVFFSIIGVLGGLATFHMDFVIMMTGIGIISLAGVVVNNAIVMVDYIGLLKKEKRRELGLEETGLLPAEVSLECIVQAGKTRLRPVLLTAITTILGLAPMAVGFNIDFNGLFTALKPGIYFGGDNALYWGPLATTVIFGLAFATVVTLVIVPAMYYVAARSKENRQRKRLAA